VRFEFLAVAIARWVTQVVARPWSVIAVFVALTGLSGYYASNNLGINTNTADMIARDLPWRQDFIAFREQFPNRFRTIIVVIDGSEAAVDAAAAALTTRLLTRPDLFLDIYQPLGGEFLERHGLLFLSPTELEDLADTLAAAQPLLGRLAKDASAANLLETLVDFQSRDPAAAGLGVLFDQVTEAMNGQLDGGQGRLDWGGLTRPVDSPARQILVVQPALDFSQARPGRAAMEALHAIRQSVSDVEVRLTGSVAMEDEELTSVVRGASLAGLLALVLVSIVLVLALRSLWLLVTALTTLIVGLVLTAAFAAIAVGHLNLISVAFAVLYIGLGIDFVIHSILRFQEIRSQGQSPEDALPAMARGVGMSLVICAVTTAAGFYAFIPTPFDGVSELGLISGTGMFLSLLVSLTLLPALLVLVASRVAVPVVRSSGQAFQLGAKRVIGLAAVVTAASLVALTGVRFDNDPLHLRGADTESVQAFNALLADERVAPRTLTVLADSEARAGDLAAALQALPEVRRAVTPATLIPTEQADKLIILEDLQLLLGPSFGRVVGGAADAERLDDALASVVATETTAKSMSSLAAAVLKFRLRLQGVGDEQRITALAQLDDSLMGEFSPTMMKLQRALTATEVTRQSLPQALVDRFVLEDGKTLVEIHPATDVAENASAAAFIDAVWQVAPHATGRPVVNREGGATVVRSFQQAFTYALITVACLVWLFLGRWTDAGLVLVPVLMVSVVTAAIAVAFGQPFNFANIIALPLLLGVGVDNGIHMVHRWRSEPSRLGSLVQVSTGRAVLFSGLTTVASFGNLAFSPHPGMASMGWILSVGMLVTLLATLVLLPALLAGRQR
jgi:hopanoid biosynthesis associated RND transporter like protein HpnN